jgi:CBS-domain-containing membrane protein
VTEPLSFRQQPIEPQHLLDDLAGGEVSHHAVQSARAKHTAHAAADLCADADAAANAVAQEHALDLLTVGQRQQQLLGSVGGLRVAGNSRRPKLKRLGQVRPHRFRQIAHVGPIGRSALEQPAAHLRSPISRLVMLGHPGFQINGGIEDV